LGARRTDPVFALEENEHRDGNGGDADINQSAGREEAEAVGEIIDWLEQELINGAFANVAGDLPVVLGDGGKPVGDRDQ